MLREKEKSYDDGRLFVRIVERSLTLLVALWLLLLNSTIFHVRVCGFKPQSRPI